MSSSSSNATSRIQIPVRVEMPIFLCLRCWADIDRRVSCTPKNYSRPFCVCSEKGLIYLAFMHVKCFFLWVDVLAKTLMNELLEEHEEWLSILPRTTKATTRDPEEEMVGGACNDRELAIELRRLNEKIRKLKDQAQIPICNYIWAFAGMAIARDVMLKLYEKA
ncbi:hypothetical protein ZWY2020_002838 [Hordeum vulgare]|nr:hypothetical protein ZWY2020_002838 [Hordeum vulgare]